VAKDDWAILVGIERYADAAFSPLGGPLADVALFKDWLLREEGGAVPETNIIEILTPSPSSAGPPKPVFSDFQYAFQNLIAPTGSALTVRDARLYLYFSGHGFSELRDQMPRATLYTADASRLFPWNIPGTYYARWTKDVALFSQIVLIMDCCRDAELRKTEMIPPLLDAQNPAAAAKADVLAIYGAPKGGKAQERPIASRGGAVHGLLTHAVIDAFESAQTDALGNVSSDAIRDHIKNSWLSICGDRPADPPEFALPERGAMILFKRPSARRSQLVEVKDWRVHETLTILDWKKQKVAEITLATIDSATLTWIDGTIETATVINGRVDVPLAPALYQLLRGTGSTASKYSFDAGEELIHV
jgi:hypothetical protein